MPTSTYMPTNDGGKAELLEHLAETLPKYAQLLEISATDVKTLGDNAIIFRRTLNVLYALQSYTQHWTEFKNQVRDGGLSHAVWSLPIS